MIPHCFINQLLTFAEFKIRFFLATVEGVFHDEFGTLKKLVFVFKSGASRLEGYKENSNFPLIDRISKFEALKCN